MYARDAMGFIGVVIIALCICTLGCGRRQPEAKRLRIAILQYVDHPGLDAARDGLIEELAKHDISDGDTANIVYRNAQGDSGMMQNIVNTTMSETYDLIITLATPISQAVKRKADGGTPIIFGVITDPVSAGLVGSMTEPGGNYTASSDQWPYRQQLDLIKRLMPEAKIVGIPWNPGEVNSQYAMKQVREAAEAIGLLIREAPISNLNEVPQAISALSGKVDVVYIPADNTAMAAAPSIIKRAGEAGLPVVAGDPGTFDAGAVAGLGVSYTDVGRQTGALAVKILLESIPAGNLPVAAVKHPTLMLNPIVAERFGIKFDDALLRDADTVVKPSESRTEH